MEKQVTIVRVYLSEADHVRHKTLMQEILNILHEQHRVKGVTVFRGIAGFGPDGVVHAADMLRVMVDLPLVIEFFDEPKVIEAVLDLLNGLLPEGQVVWWTANCR